MKRSQKQKVLDHIRKYGKITSLEAAIRYKITRLSARIYELRHDDGYDIQNRRITKKTDGEYVTYDEYYLEESA